MDDSRDRLVRKGSYIDGSFVRPERVDGYINGVNPGDRADILGRFAFSEDAVEDAVEHATIASRIWRHVPLAERVAAVRRFRQTLAKAGEKLIVLSTRETGRPSWETRQELGQTLLALEQLIEEGPVRLAPKVLEQTLGRADRFPRGVVGMLLPFAQPLYYICVWTAAAMLAGNTVVFKPSKFTPGLGQHLAEMWDQCKLPRGVINMVQGSGSGVGRRLLGHPRLGALMVAGSHETVSEVRRLLLDRSELPLITQSAGKGAAVVLDGCELDRAVYDTMVGAFLGSGQRPFNTGRVIVQAGIYDEFIDALLRRTANLTVGYGFDKSVFMGPLISENLRSRFRKYGRALTQGGAGPLLEGSFNNRTERRGFYVTPAIHLVDWQSGQAFLDAEPVGPTLLVYRVGAVDEAVALHNQLAHRPVASVYPSTQEADLQGLVDRLRAGVVHINLPTTTSTLPLPAVGMGRSGGVGTGVELLDALTTPRTLLSADRPFNPAQALPGTNWEADLTHTLVEVDDLDEDTLVDDDLSNVLEPEV